MRTSFHHQPEAQHPNFSLSVSWQADYPIFRGANRKTCAHSEPYRFWPRRSFGSIHSTCLSALVRRPRDGSVVSSLHCMNDPQPEGHMASYIARRKFLATLLCGAGVWPLAARAQQAGDRESAGQMPRVGWLWPGRSAGNSSEFAGFQQGLRELGYVEGKNIIVEYRFGENSMERLRDLAAASSLT